jgi:ABC-type glutathione transport system ATPase component
MAYALEINHVWKYYSTSGTGGPENQQPAIGLQDITLKVRSREIFGVVGAPGAGKTTLMEILRGRLQPDSGEITFHPLPQQSITAPPDLQGCCPGQLSDPPILLIDEPDLPLIGTDLEQRSGKLRAWVKDQGGTIILATCDHHLALRCCDRVALVENGRVLSVIPARFLEDSPQNAPLYEFRVRGHFNPDWYDWMGGLELITEGENSFFYIPVVDQASLYGMIFRFRDTGLTLLSVNCLRTRIM